MLEPLFVLIILMILYQTRTYCWRIRNEHLRGPWCLHFQHEVEGIYVSYIQPFVITAALVGPTLYEVCLMPS